MAALGTQGDLYACFSSTDILACSFNAMFAYANDIFEPLLINKSMVVISILTIVQWHFRFHGGLLAKQWGRPSIKLHRMAMNVLILQVYYNPLSRWIKHRPFVTSLLLIITDTFAFFVFRLIKRCCVKCACAEKAKQRELIDIQAMGHGYGSQYWLRDPTEEDADVADLDETGMLEARSIYTDVTRGIGKTTVVWVAQSILVIFLVVYLNSDKHSKDLLECKFVNWICAVALQLYLGDTNLGGNTSIHFWGKLWKSDLKDIGPDSWVIRRQTPVTWCLWKLPPVAHFCIDKSPLDKLLTFRIRWLFRFVFDVSINVVARNLIMFTFPILIITEDPLDFVKDCLAVFFVTTLDDIDSTDVKSIHQMIIILKYRLYFNDVIEAGHPHEHSGYRKLLPTEDDKSDRNVKKILSQAESCYIQDNKEKFEGLFNFKDKIHKDVGQRIWRNMCDDFEKEAHKRKAGSCGF